jgi:hypothetical protein
MGVGMRTHGDGGEDLAEITEQRGRGELLREQAVGGWEEGRWPQRRMERCSVRAGTGEWWALGEGVLGRRQRVTR